MAITLAELIDAVLATSPDPTYERIIAALTDIHGATCTCMFVPLDQACPTCRDQGFGTNASADGAEGPMAAKKCKHGRPMASCPMCKGK